MYGNTPSVNSVPAAKSVLTNKYGALWKKIFNRNVLSFIHSFIHPSILVIIHWDEPINKSRTVFRASVLLLITDNVITFWGKMILCVRSTSRPRGESTKCRPRSMCLFYSQNKNILWLCPTHLFEKFTRCEVCGFSILDWAFRVLIALVGQTNSDAIYMMLSSREKSHSLTHSLISSLF